MIIVNTGGSLDCYWNVEDRTEYKNEYIDGQIISRVATSIRHVKIAQSLAMDLWSREDVPWHVLTGLRMKVEQTGAYVWPDVMVYEKPGRFEVRRPLDDEMLLDPVLIVEVYSPLTEGVTLTTGKSSASVSLSSSVPRGPWIFRSTSSQSVSHAPSSM